MNTFCVSGQDTIKADKIKEYYLSLTDISPINVSIKYKRQFKNRTFIKIGLVNLSAYSNFYVPNISTIYKNQNYTFSSGLELGLEFRKTLSDKFTFYQGPNTSFTYQTFISVTENPALPFKQRKNVIQTYDGGIPYTLGLLFNIKNHFFLSAEINPGLFFSYRIADNGQYPQLNQKIMSANIKLDNKLGLLSIVYRI